MRKFTIVALVALCAAIQGEVYAMGTTSAPLTHSQTTGIDGEALVGIWVAVANETGYTYHEVKGMYQRDELAISYGENEGTYVVEFFNAEGIGTVLIIDSI